MKILLGENIKKNRKRLNLTQEKLAEVLGVTIGAVHKWETGMSAPELSMLVKMASFFEVSVDVLLGYELENNKKKVGAYSDEIVRNELKDIYRETLKENGE